MSGKKLKCETCFCGSSVWRASGEICNKKKMGETTLVRACLKLANLALLFGAWLHRDQSYYRLRAGEVRTRSRHAFETGESAKCLIAPIKTEKITTFFLPAPRKVPDSGSFITRRARENRGVCARSLFSQLSADGEARKNSRMPILLPFRRVIGVFYLYLAPR